jgi:penicillin-binding protein 1C
VTRARRLALCSSLLPAAAAAACLVRLATRPYPVGELDGFRDSVRILDREGRLLREAANGDGQRARWTPLAEISPQVVAATIAVEDARFFSHPGVDPASVARAVLQCLRAGRPVSGASTLTMQLARLVRPHPRTLGGKLGEIVDALRLERAVRKDVVLEQYLNRAPYGPGLVGVEAASQRYFGKPSAHLSLAEAALLAGLPQGPTAKSPLRNPPAARARQRVVLARMRATGRATSEEVARALAEPLQLSPPPPPIEAPQFTDWVLAQRPAPGDVPTTLDAAIQSPLEKLVADHVASLAPGGVTNASVVVLDNERCEVLAMVGSADPRDPDAGAVNGALARRQPGSALKPFTYALAFERGWSPRSVLADVEARYGGAQTPLFAPQNFSQDFSGPVLMGEALGRSLNVPAVRVAETVGVGALLDRLHLLGFASLDRSAAYYGLGLTLGNGEVTLLELAQGYAALARGGLICKATPFPDPHAAPAGSRGEPRAFAPEVAALVTEVLEDEGLRAVAFGANNALMLGFPAAVKTGTSTNFRDGWVIGYTPRFTVAVWTGDFSGRSLNHLTGAAGAGPLFHQAMKLVVGRGALDRVPRRAAPAPGLVEVAVCATSGQKPGPHCPRRRSVRILEKDVPVEECRWHRRIMVDRRNGGLAGESCPSQFVEPRVFEILPALFAEWQAGHRVPAPPSRYSPLCPSRGPVPGALVVTYPRKDEVFLIEPGYDRRTQSVPLSAEVDPHLPEVTWLLDGAPVARVGWPYETAWPLAEGRHRVQLVAAGQRSDPVEFEVR